MLRLLVTAVISCLISFGAISKSLQTSELMNHVTTNHKKISDHHSHHHGHKHGHSHGHQQSKKSKHNKKHSHQYDFSLLSQLLNVEVASFEQILIPSNVIDVEIPVFDTSLTLQGFSYSLFRPPIA